MVFNAEFQSIPPRDAPCAQLGGGSSGVVDILEGKECALNELARDWFGNELFKPLECRGEKACRPPGVYGLSTGEIGVELENPLGSPLLNIEPSRLFLPDGTAYGWVVEGCGNDPRFMELGDIVGVDGFECRGVIAA